MQSVSQILTAQPRLFRGRRYRHRAVFVRDPRAISTPLDRNTRSRLLFLARRIDFRTKDKGRRNGLLGYTGLLILSALVCHFSCSKTGLCVPSYHALMMATKLSKQAVADGLGRLEACGLIKVTRRLERQQVTRISPVTGMTETIMGVVQASNVYSFPTIARVEQRIDGFALLPTVPARPKAPSLLARFLSVQAESSNRTESQTEFNLMAAACGRT
jgi:hypothetical protein